MFENFVSEGGVFETDAIGAPDNVLIWSVIPDGYNYTETVVLKNVGNSQANITGWTLTDLEGKKIFGTTLIEAGQELVIAQSRNDYMHLAKTAPDLTYDCFAEGSTKNFILANSGDEVILLDTEQNVVDVLIYGDSTYNGPGWHGEPVKRPSKGVYLTRQGPRVVFEGVVETEWADTDTAKDWDTPVIRKLGSSNFDAGHFSFQSGTVFLMPDSGLEVLEEAIAASNSSILIHVYEFTSERLASQVANASKRGVNVKILIDGEPVGGMSTMSKAAAKLMQDSGASVKMVSKSNDVWGQKRYAFIHCKYLVIDSSSVVVMSENLKDSGFPHPDREGNRGWGAQLHSAEGAALLSNLFFADWNATDVVDYPGWTGTFIDFFSNPWTRGLSPLDIGPGTASLHFTPDCTLVNDPVLTMVNLAQHTLYVQQFYIYKWWGTRHDCEITRPNPYLEAVINAARRGVEVKVLLDATYYNVEKDNPRDNDDTVEYINRISKEESLDMEARLVSPVQGFDKIHNKGMVADGQYVMVSSINWNQNSPCANREVALVIHSPEGAWYFQHSFKRDWLEDISHPRASIQCPNNAVLGDIVILRATQIWDDVGVVNYSWDINGDGEGDLFGKEVYWQANKVGTIEIALTVSDAAGNLTTTKTEIRIHKSEGTLSMWWVLLILVLVVGIAGAFFFFKR